jgi:hypothetical protein
MKAGGGNLQINDHDKSPLKTANKLGAILFQLPPSFTVSDFKNIEGFLDRLPSSSSSSSLSGYDYAVEFRPWNMLKHSGRGNWKNSKCKPCLLIHYIGSGFTIMQLVDFKLTLD